MTGEPGLDVKVKGDEQAARMIGALAKRGEDARPVLRRLMEDLRIAEDPWFRTHGGGTWAPLADITRTEKEQAGFAADPLVRTGFLGNSLTARTGGKSVRRVTRDEMHFGTRVFYAKFHAIGGALPVRNPVVPTDVGVRRKMVLDVKRYLMTGRLKGGFILR